MEIVTTVDMQWITMLYRYDQYHSLVAVKNELDRYNSCTVLEPQGTLCHKKVRGATDNVHRHLQKCYVVL